jgi:hypothetical protein
MILSIGANLVCLALPTLELIWTREVGATASFGLLWSPPHHCLISQGEREIQRYDLEGKLAWSASGYDIFTYGVKLLEEGVQAIDFENNVHLFEWESGKLLRGPGVA